MKIKNLTCVLITFTLILLLIFSVYGCTEKYTKIYTPIQNSGTEDYNVFTADNGTIRFSFEYPSFFILRNSELNPSSHDISIKLTGTKEEEEKGIIRYLQINADDKFKYKNSTINCRIPSDVIGQEIQFVYIDSGYYEGYGSAKKAMEWRIFDYNSLHSSKYIKDYSYIINKVEVGTIKGWEVAFSFTELPMTDFPISPIRKNCVSVVSRYLYFKYNDMVWEIFLYGSAATDAQNKEDYEHVIKTLKILD